MKNNRKKFKLATLGFTLIELLAVIIILGIIALITIPLVINIVEKSKKEAFKNSAYGIIKSGELYYSNKLLEVEEMKEDVTFTFPEAKELEIKGKKPTSGNMIVTKEGKIELAITNGKWCATKELNKTEIKISNNLENCNISTNSTDSVLLSMSIEMYLGDSVTLNFQNGNFKIESLNENIATVENGKIKAKSIGTTKATIDINGTKKEIPITVTEYILTSTNKCIHNNTICENGTRVAVQVNDTENYEFYVIDDTGSELTLIMNKNLGENIAWISKKDYEATGGTNYGSYDKGPLTALRVLKKRTDNWTNIKSYSYTLKDDKPVFNSSEKINYKSIEVTDVRARMLTATETKNLGCKTDGGCPKYLYEYTSGSSSDKLPRGYWLTTSYNKDTLGYYYAYSVTYSGNVGIYDLESNSYCGIRPVIKVPKNL